MYSKIKTCFIAICSQEYLGHYKVLFNSIKKHAPEVDNILYFIGNSVPTNYEQVVDITQLEAKCIYKDKLINICSLRAHVVLDAFDRGYDNVVFFGAKLELFSEPKELLNYYQYYDALVTPHLLEPLPNDGKSPSNASVSFTGHISTDLVAFHNTPPIRKFLDWQNETMKTQCRTTGHTYLDQSWLNFLPFFCKNIYICHELGYNVAYWNFNQRGLEFKNNQWVMKDNSPLVAFQYSGLDLNNPKKISKYQDRYEATGDFLNFLTHYSNRVKNG